MVKDTLLLVWRQKLPKSVEDYKNLEKVFARLRNKTMG